MNELLAPFLPNSMPTSQVELSLSCRNLINTDILSKSDPYCVVYMRESWQEQYYEITRTEVIKDTLNPQWVKKVNLDFKFETMQKIRFEVRDEDSQGYDFLGQYETTVGDLVSFSGRQDIGKLRGIKGHDCGEIIIVTEEVSCSRQTVEIQFQASNLPKLHTLFRNDPFLVISRSNEDSYSVVAKTEPAHSTQNPTWKPLTIRMTTLCNGDYERDIKIDCFDYRKNGDHQIIGTCYTTLRSLNAEDEPLMNLVNEELRQTHPSRSDAGLLKVLKINVNEEISFLDYIRNGTQVHFAVAIDYTGSNGAHLDPNSLHYLCDDKLNSYEIALSAVGEIIQHYDSSRLFPAFGKQLNCNKSFYIFLNQIETFDSSFDLCFHLGFGAKMPPNFKKVSHQFPLNNDSKYPYCTSVEEILKHYWTQLNTVQLSGPTYFAPVINNMVSIAKQYQTGKDYFVLLIITDGIITDIQKTKRAIIEASKLPISIIIVGVGFADFKKMSQLDSDMQLLSSGGRTAERDIVQFVPLHKFLINSGDDQHIKSQADLAKEVLAEIPEQFTSYMKSRGFKPKTVTPF